MVNDTELSIRAGMVVIYKTKIDRRRGMLKLRFPLIVIFVMILSVSAQGAILLDRVVAVVNQDVITWSELYKAMEMQESPALKALSVEKRNRIFKKQESPFLDSLIDLKLELQQARSDGLSVSDKEVNEAINSIRKKYSMTDADLTKSLKEEGYSLKEYRKKLGEQILVSRVVDREVRSTIVVTDSDVRNYVAEHRKELEGGHGYHIRQIFFKAPKIAAERGRIEEKAEDIIKRIRNGENFADLAKEYSEDPTASSGGDLGFIEKDQMAKEFRDAVSKMKPGDVSSPFWTVSGLHIIKLIEKPGNKSMSELEDEAREQLNRSLFKAKYDEWIKGLRRKAFIEVKL